jgi:hypothetical protein
MCPLWWKSSCELQRFDGVQRATEENTPTSLFEAIHYFCTSQTYLTPSARSNIDNNDVMLISETQFTEKCYLKFPNSAAGTVRSGTAIIIKKFITK